MAMNPLSAYIDFVIYLSGSPGDLKQNGALEITQLFWLCCDYWLQKALKQLLIASYNFDQSGSGFYLTLKTK